MADSQSGDIVEAGNPPLEVTSLRDSISLELALIAAFPTEILTHVFVLTLPPHEVDAEPAPWTISAVCAHWREIVISQPLFWTSIRYARPEAPELFRARRLVRPIETQLGRSGQLPLDIEFHVDRWNDMTFEDLKILQVICKHAGRWATVSLSGPSDLSYQISLSTQRPLLLGNLHKLAIETPHDSSQDTVDCNFLDAPLLQTVFVNRSRELRAYPAQMELPWSQLLRYGVCNTWQGHLDTFVHASNLVDCTLELASGGRMPDPETLVDLPRLRRLSASDAFFLKHLKTPALQELYCEYYPPVISTFFHRQNCELQKLVLWGYYSSHTDHSDLMRLVESVPTVTQLSLLFPLPVEYISDLLSRPTMAPALGHLTISLETSTVKADEDFMQAIESRWRDGGLRSLKVYYRVLKNVVGNWLDVLQTQGMNCVVYDSPRPRPENLDDIPPELLVSGDRFEEDREIFHRKRHGEAGTKIAHKFDGEKKQQCQTGNCRNGLDYACQVGGIGRCQTFPEDQFLRFAGLATKGRENRKSVVIAIQLPQRRGL
ncbi:hypothetical protein K438DRAFT_1748087 [Mycena galopus ATCC 62051]|nr:hypothetical protein K438DRAFT_1748087 [Mycena galopus ATCC 62051]